jgi:hypothetical protein
LWPKDGVGRAGDGKDGVQQARAAATSKAGVAANKAGGGKGGGGKRGWRWQGRQWQVHKQGWGERGRKPMGDVALCWFVM